jgi:hypothetical protein
MSTDDPRRRLLRPNVLAWAVLGAIVVSFAAVVIAADGASSLAGRVGGDFPAFYGSGSIVADGDLDRLYDFDRQLEAQLGLHHDAGALYFAYPPPVAGAYSLLALLGYVPAYVLHTLIMGAALVAAFLVIRPMLPATRPEGPVIAAVAATFLPAFMAVTLGQNSAIVVLLVAASWRLARDGRDELAGLALGLLLFKPQYAVPLIGLYLVRGRWRLVGTSGLVAVGWWLAGVLMLGTSWVGDWVSQVGDFNTLDAEINGANAISWLGMAEHVLGVSSTPALLVGGTLALATATWLVVVWRRSADDQLALPMAAASVGVLLISPHAMFYDATLLLLGVAALAAAGHSLSTRLLAIAWGLGAMHPLKEVAGITPVSLVVLGALAVVLHMWWRSRRNAGAPHDGGLQVAGRTR